MIPRRIVTPSVMEPQASPPNGSDCCPMSYAKGERRVDPIDSYASEDDLVSPRPYLCNDCVSRPSHWMSNVQMLQIPPFLP